jgi:hypothetical protein
MNIRKSCEILEISHEEIVDLLSTALYGSSYLSAEYDKDFYNSIPKDKTEGDCYEDHMADVLLNGGEIYFYDNDSDGEIYNNRSNAEVIDEGNGTEYTQYTITLIDLIDGLQRAANGTYKTNNDSKWIAECFSDFEQGDGDMDLIEADALMQIILFDELIYG